MLAASTGLINLLNSVEQSGLDVRLQMTLPGNVYPNVSLAIESLAIDASTTTDMPDGTRLIAGYPAMQATFTLAGLVDARDETLTAAWLFGIYPVQATIASPLYRQMVLGSLVTIDVGGAPIGGGAATEWLRKFTGTIDSYEVDPVAGSVAFTCIDYRNKLRSIPAMPAVVTVPPYNAGLTSEYVVDALLRVATNDAYSSWPAQRAQCLLSAGMRSSLWPEVGVLKTTLNEPLPVFTPGLFGSALQSATGLTFGSGYSQSPTYTLAAPLGTTLFIEFWATTSAGGIPAQCVFTDDAGNIPCYFEWDGTNIIFWGWGQSYAVAKFPSVYGTHYVAASILCPAVGSSAWSGTLWLDGVASAVSGGNVARTASPIRTVAVQSDTGAAIEALQITAEPAAGLVLNNTFTPKALLDPSLNNLVLVPAIEAGTDPWQVLQQIADAEQAVCGFDEAGIFHFWNRKTIRAMPVARTITSNVNLKSLAMTAEAASLANHVSVPYTGWTFGAVGLVYTLADLVKVPRNSTVVYNVTLEGVAGAIDTTVALLPNAHTFADGMSWYRASADVNGATAHPGLNVNVSQSAAGLIVTFVNATGKDAWLISPASYTDITFGTISLWLGGQPVTANPEVLADIQYPPLINGVGGAASSARGDVAVALSSDPWIQDPISAAALALDLLIDMYLPRPTLAALDIVPDPRLQLLDRVHIQDPGASGMDEYAAIWGWTLTFDADTWGMTIDARTIANPGQWILGIAGRSELGQTTWI